MSLKQEVEAGERCDLCNNWLRDGRCARCAAAWRRVVQPTAPRGLDFADVFLMALFIAIPLSIAGAWLWRALP